jgi:hypothetical protein
MSMNRKNRFESGSSEPRRESHGARLECLRQMPRKVQGEAVRRSHVAATKARAVQAQGRRRLRVLGNSARRESGDLPDSELPDVRHRKESMVYLMQRVFQLPRVGSAP